VKVFTLAASPGAFGWVKTGLTPAAGSAVGVGVGEGRAAGAECATTRTGLDLCVGRLATSMAGRASWAKESLGVAIAIRTQALMLAMLRRPPILAPDMLFSIRLYRTVSGHYAKSI